jgi:hypothetical protein
MRNGLLHFASAGAPAAAPRKPRKVAFGWWAWAQVALIALAPLVVLLPKGDDALLIAPLTSGDRSATIRWALNAGAKPVAPGPYEGSYIVQGSFAALLAPGILHGALVINARFAGCGGPNPRTIE